LYKNLDIIFLGGLFPKETEAEILKNSMFSIQNAANNLQWGIVNGLDDNLNAPVKIINSLYIGSFPKRYKKIFINTYNFSHTLEDNKDINVGFLNFTGIKIVSRYISLKPHLKSWTRSKSSNKKVIIAYAMTSTFTKLLRYIKKIDKDVITCLIVPDLPQYMNLSNNNNLIYSILKKIEMKRIRSNMKFIDSYVLLTKYMRNELKINAPYVVVEGISTNAFKNLDCLPTQSESIKTILYCGGLSKEYGVVNLVRAFEKLHEDNFRLLLCGSGNAELEIQRACQRDSRIIYKGQLRREEVLKLQKISTVLVNPRPNNEEFTKFSFPSKILEYMSSGNPVVAYKLDGVPDEYYDYIYPVVDNIDGLFITLKEVLSKTQEELHEKGLCAKEFVLNQKNGTKQAAKIIKMINLIATDELKT